MRIDGQTDRKRDRKTDGDNEHNRRFWRLGECSQENPKNSCICHQSVKVILHPRYRVVCNYEVLCGYQGKDSYRQDLKMYLL
jgi:hypothetical protein